MRRSGIILIALTVAGLNGCTSRPELCANRVAIAKPSPSGRHMAVLFQRDCGATIGPSTQISIVDIGREPIGTGNVFVADDGHGAAKPAKWGGPWAAISWAPGDRLLVRYDVKSRVIDRTEARSGVAVGFETVKR